MTPWTPPIYTKISIVLLVDCSFYGMTRGRGWDIVLNGLTAAAMDAVM